MNSPAVLDSHHKHHHKEGSAVECQKCKNKFNGLLLLRKHEREVECTALKNFECEYCSKWYKSCGALYNHVESVHPACTELARKKKREEALRAATATEDTNDTDGDDAPE